MTNGYPSPTNPTPNKPLQSLEGSGIPLLGVFLTGTQQNPPNAKVLGSCRVPIQQPKRLRQTVFWPGVWCWVCWVEHRSSSLSETAPVDALGLLVGGPWALACQRGCWSLSSTPCRVLAFA